ncbi:hypothetical protein XH98_37170 [Bradyrhizobium sp. CCBAU 51745]|nr:hypothetical protein [Bradyrhizobium sp. CCBAU 51745]
MAPFRILIVKLLASSMAPGAFVLGQFSFMFDVDHVIPCYPRKIFVGRAGPAREGRSQDQ